MAASRRPRCVIADPRDDGHGPAAPVACDVARRAVACHLDAVWRAIEIAASDRGDTEAMHRLRVACRRSLAVLEAFQPILPRSGRKWFVTRLRLIKRSAGKARDLDVMNDRLVAGSHRVGEAHGVAVSARRALLETLRRERRTAREPVATLHRRLRNAGWQARATKLQGSVQRTGIGAWTLPRYARRRLRPVLARFQQRADHRMRGGRDIHRFRIEGRRLRYLVEVFSTIFSERVRRRCERAMGRLQSDLGEFTDHAAAADRLGWLFSRTAERGSRQMVKRLLRRERDDAKRVGRACRRQWRRSHRQNLSRTITKAVRKATA